MKRLIVPVAAVLFVGLIHVCLAAPLPVKRGKAFTTLEKKMLGSWKGQDGCDGRLVFRADGTYELTEYGPGNSDTAGTWKARGDALPATLLLTCKTSEIPEEVGKTMQVKLIKLDDKSLAIEYADKNGSPSGVYTRVKK